MKKCDCRAYVIAGLMLATFATAVQAQYVWVDERGRKQFSDMPPPASVPAHRILKQPGVPAERPMAGDAAGGEPETRAPTPPAQQAEAPPTLAERDAEFRRR
ncbi:MAG TPA: DUF4124 domain-containing protein, partial [Noviherbaspirillum sp.]|nr:DUF4124 domain-containing protein [Noviherbaspirillum sp.]